MAGIKRKKNGQFAKGTNSGPVSGGGRKPREYEKRYAEAFQRCISEGDWDAIICRARDDAKNGDDKARKWISDNLVGLPVQKSEINADIRTEILLPKGLTTE